MPDDLGPIDPGDIDDVRTALGMVAGMTYEHYEQLKGSGFTSEQAFELALQYHWSMVERRE